MRPLFLALLASSLLIGCAKHQPAPLGYTGPVAKVADSGFVEDDKKAQLFVLSEVNGSRIPSSLEASAELSRGDGFKLTPFFSRREVPAIPMKVKLIATHTTGAPVHELFSRAAGSFLHVEGIVDFDPQPNGNYVVKGELKKAGSSVWIEDAITHERVTQTIVQR